MLNLIDQYRRYPGAESARAVREYFESHPSRIWLLQTENIRVLAAAGVRGVFLVGLSTRRVA